MNCIYEIKVFKRVSKLILEPDVMKQNSLQRQKHENRGVYGDGEKRMRPSYKCLSVVLEKCIQKIR